MNSRLFKFGMTISSHPAAYPQLFVGYSGSPLKEIFKYIKSTDTFTSLVAPSQITTAVSFVSYSADGKFLAVAFNSAPYLQLYRRQNNGFSAPLSLDLTGITSTVYSITFSKDGKYLLAVTYTGSYVGMWKRNPDGESYSQLAANLLPHFGGPAWPAVISPDNNYMVSTDGFINLFKGSNDNFNVGLARPTNYVVSKHNGFAWSANSALLFASTNGTTAACAVYQHNGDTFSKLTDSTGSGASTGSSVALSPDETHVAITCTVAPYLVVFKWNGSTLTPLGSMPTLPGAAHYCSYSVDGKYLAVAHDDSVAGTPRVSVFIRNGDAYTKISSFAVNAASASLSGIAAVFGPPAS